MKLVLVRVDGRLVHGQVTAAWSKAVGAEHILVANDKAANDPNKKMLLELGAPAGVRITVISMDDAVRKVKEHVGGVRVLLVVESLADLKALFDNDLGITEVNIGGAYHEPGKTKYRKALYMDEDDKALVKSIISKGVRLYYQIAPADKQEDLTNILR